MPRWEYLRVEGEDQTDEDGRGPPDDITNEKLDELGGNGWEMVSGHWVEWRGSSYLVEAVFKRRKDESEDEDF